MTPCRTHNYKLIGNVPSRASFFERFFLFECKRCKNLCQYRRELLIAQLTGKTTWPSR